MFREENLRTIEIKMDGTARKFAIKTENYLHPYFNEHGVTCHFETQYLHF